MIKFLDKRSLWPVIFKLSESCRAAKVAVAYVGKGAANKLMLKSGDTLVTCMSLQSLQAGQVDPFEIEKFIKRGVKVFSKSCLHAKVYVLGNKVITCSANLSSSSEKNLIESGILTDDKKAVSAARKFIDSNSETDVDEPYLIWAKRNYIPSQGHGGNYADPKEMTHRFWLMRTEDAYLPDEVLDELSLADNAFKSKIPNKRKFFIDYLQVTPGSNMAINAKEGDKLIEIYSVNGRLRVHAPKMILSNTTLYSYNKPILRIAEPLRENSFTWQSFKSHLKKHGLAKIGKITERELKGNTLLAIQAFFSRQNII